MLLLPLQMMLLFLQPVQILVPLRFLLPNIGQLERPLLIKLLA